MREGYLSNYFPEKSTFEEKYDSLGWLSKQRNSSIGGILELILEIHDKVVQIKNLQKSDIIEESSTLMYHCEELYKLDDLMMDIQFEYKDTKSEEQPSQSYISMKRHHLIHEVLEKIIYFHKKVDNPIIKKSSIIKRLNILMQNSEELCLFEKNNLDNEFKNYYHKKDKEKEKKMKMKLNKKEEESESESDEDKHSSLDRSSKQRPGIISGSFKKIYILYIIAVYNE